MEIFRSQALKENFATDLTWQVLDPFANKMFSNDQIKDFLASGSRLFAKYKNGSDVNFGICAGFDEDTKASTKVYSLAAKAATAKRFLSTTSLILISNDEIPGTAYATGIISGNVILDESFNVEDVFDIYSSFKNICESSSRVFYVHGDVQHPSIEINHAYTLTELLTDKTAKKCHLQPLKNEALMNFKWVAQHED